MVKLVEAMRGGASRAGDHPGRSCGGHQSPPGPPSRRQCSRVNDFFAYRIIRCQRDSRDVEIVRETVPVVLNQAVITV